VNCFEFRRLCLSIPDSGDPAYIAHAEECSDCLKYAEGVRRMDASLVEALNVPIPSDLVARLKLRTVIDAEQENRSRGFRYAIAASVLLMVGASLLGYRTWSINSEYQRLTQAVVTHIEHEHVTDGFTTVNAPNVLASMFIENGALNATAVGDVSFTKYCPVMGRQAIHAVVSTDAGPVTIIFVPDLALPRVRDDVFEGLKNHIVPMGDGALILTSETDASFNAVADQVQQAVDWGI
jgi:hypothetical protein